MEKTQKVIVEAVPWSEEAAVMLQSAVISASVEDYRRQVEAGAVLFQVIAEQSGAVLGFYILRIDQHAVKTIGVLVAAAGVPGFAFADCLMPLIESQFEGVDEIHQYASRPGMIRKLTGMGWEATHLVMRKKGQNHG